MSVNNVEEMEVFKKSHKVTMDIYHVTGSFPQEEKFAMVSQMRRAAYSIPSNLMEGGHRNNSSEYRHFAGIAKGSAGELKYFLMLARDLGYVAEGEYASLRAGVEEISRMLSGLIKALSKK